MILHRCVNLVLLKLLALTFFCVYPCVSMFAGNAGIES